MRPAGLAILAASCALTGLARAQEAARPPQQEAAQPGSQDDETTSPAQRELGTTPLYDQLRDAERRLRTLDERARLFEFHGYLRTGFGLNGRGGQQVAFQAPGAGAKYRLGNEAETYGEFSLATNWIPSPESPAWFRTDVMLQADTTNAANYGNTDRYRLRESFVQAGGVLPWQTGAIFWAGQRYYRRQHIDINDYFAPDMSGYGAGAEDLNTPVGLLAVAVLGGANEQVTGGRGRHTKVNLDVRLYEVPGPFGQISLWFLLSRTPRAFTAEGMPIEAAHGWAVGIKHLVPSLLGGYNNLIVVYARGVSENLRTDVQAPTPYLKNASNLLVSEHLLLQPSRRFAVMGAFIYQRRHSGHPDERESTWVSFGARPVVFFTQHLSLAAESGADRTEDGADRFSGWLSKVSVAPQIATGSEFFSRPVLRLFFTYAWWSEGFRGQVGTPAYWNRTRGLSYGVQAETWW